MNSNELLNQLQELNQITNKKKGLTQTQTFLLSTCQRVDCATINKSTTCTMITLAQEKVASLQNEREERKKRKIGKICVAATKIRPISHVEASNIQDEKHKSQERSKTMHGRLQEESKGVCAHEGERKTYVWVRKAK